MREGLATRAGHDLEIERLRAELRSQAREARVKEAQLERYAADLRETFVAERKKAEELHASYLLTVGALTNAVEARDAYTARHAERVTAYGLELARRVDPELAAAPQTEFGFLLHDVGKLAIEDAILWKPGPLTEAERDAMREHVKRGFNIVSQIPFLREAAQIVLYHHEKFDGSGYPEGLSGEQIPLAARIFAVADTLDAITTDRPYRLCTDLAHARAEIRSKAGTQFDPDVVDALDTISDETLGRIGAETE